jgi:hypothetical protein
MTARVQTEPMELDPQYPKRERIFVGAFLFCSGANLIHFIRTGYLTSTAFYKLGARRAPLGYPTAPEAYRIGVMNFARLLAWILPGSMRGMIGQLIDFLSISAVLTLIYLLTVEGFPANNKMHQKRIVVITLLLAFLQFPLAWVVPYQRPETLPTAFYIAFGLWCLTRAKSHWVWIVLLLVMTYLQAFVRSDVPFVFGLTLMLMSLGKALESWGSRLQVFLRGAAVALIAGGVQLYLQLVRFPHLKYAPGVPVVMFGHNLDPHVFSFFLIALLPFFGLAILMAVRPIPLRAIEAFTVALCLLYLPLWLVVGIVSEVRIFVPFLFALCMVAARAVAEFLMTTREDGTRLRPQGG